MIHLIPRCWCDFLSLSAMSCVISDAIPILWFGDLEAYSQSPIRIVTVGLNPSNKEFQEKDCDPIDLFRFKTAKTLKGKAKLCPKDIAIYRSAMNEYFKDIPYANWFKPHEFALNQLNATYGGKMLDKGLHPKNTAIHVDIETAIPTSPTWGGLCPNCQDTIRMKCSGVFTRLLKILQPHVIIIAVNEATVSHHFLIKRGTFDAGLSLNLHPAKYANLGNNDPSHSSSYIRTYLLPNNCTLIWTKNMNGMPWGGMKKDEPAKLRTLNAISAYINNKYKVSKTIVI